MSITQQIQNFLVFLNMDFYPNWSLMKIIDLGLVMIIMVGLIWFFFEKAGSS